MRIVQDDRGWRRELLDVRVTSSTPQAMRQRMFSSSVSRGVTERVVLCAAFLLLVFLLGGSERGDAASQIPLRPLAALFAAYGLVRLRREHVAAYPFHFAMAAALVAVPLLQLVPLPPGLWTLFPGRSLVAQIDIASSGHLLWHPLSLAPLQTQNALCSLIVPIAALALAAPLAAAEQKALIVLVLIGAAVSLLVSILQTSGALQSPLPVYRVAAKDVAHEAMGLFGNRNHQAILLSIALPMAVGLARLLRNPASLVPLSLAICATFVITPLLLSMGSRVGLVTGICGVALALVLSMPANGRPPALGKRGRTISRATLLAGATAVIVILIAGMAALAVWLGRAEAWTRLSQLSLVDDLRLESLPVTWNLVKSYFPAGAGMGAFPLVYQIAEPDRLLSPVYLNQAHNDWLEVLITAGLAGALLLCAGAAAFVRALMSEVTAGRTDDGARVLRRLGLGTIFILAVTSISDYPLRVPTISVLFVFAALWAGCAGANLRPQAPDPTDAQYIRGKA